jgi:CBS domain-containing protein
MLVREIMTSPAYSVLEGATLEEALKLMATSRVTSLPVVDGGGRVVGIISEADLLKSDLEPDPRAHVRPTRQATTSPLATVGQVMTPHPHTVREDTDVAELAHTFATTHWKSVPVVREELLQGVVSRSDVIRAMSRTDEQIAAISIAQSVKGVRHVTSQPSPI